MGNSNQVVVVGGGLAGLSAAHTIYENGGNVCVIDKSSFFGGNSTKATSGINGALTRTQIAQQIQDSAEQFYNDTVKSAREKVRPELVKVLTYNSGSAVDWLQDKFKIDLSLVARLGGHSHPRTHRGKERFPGMTITYALMERLEELAKTEPNRVTIKTKCRGSKLIKDSNGTVIGIEYTTADGQTGEEYGPVVLATGGYAADFTETSILKKHRPDIYNLPTTNGDYCTGDGLKMTLDIGGSAVDLESVQVHPTGLVDPKEPDAKVKFLAAEALRGVGGILLDANGKRFVDELQHRDFVTGEMWKNKFPIRLVLNSKSGKEIEWHVKHYMGRGLMRKFDTGADLAKEIGVSAKTLEETFNDYNRAAETKNDKFKKKFFSNTPYSMNDHFYVALMTPVLHFTMGGVKVNDNAQVCNEQGPIPGLFAAGEVCGGIHGANRLGGSALLTCVVYGRVAGASASRHQYQQLSQNAASRLNNISGHLNPNAFSTLVQVDPQSQSLTLTFNLGQQGGGQPQQHAAQSSHQATSQPQGQEQSQSQAKSAEPSRDVNKVWTQDEIAKHNTEKDCWVIVNGQVLDVTKFMHEHPGGKKAILLFAGRDASEEFNMLHKKDVVEKYAPEAIIGKIN
jgi:flavocytochrome c